MKLTGKQEKFCKEYLIDMNATRAAKAAGYSHDTAHAIGAENLTKPLIKEYLSKRLAEMAMPADEAIKILGDIARGSLNDYFITRKVQHQPLIEVPLTKIVKDLKEEIKFEQAFADESNLKDLDLEIFQVEQSRRKQELKRLMFELKHDPMATKIMRGPVELVDSVELDMVALVRDKERGRIKAITPTQFGVKVEMYSASDAIVNILKMDGKFKENLDLTSGGEKLNQQPALTDKQFGLLLNLIDEKSSTR